MKLSFDHIPLMATYVMMCQDIAQKTCGTPIDNNETLANCFLTGFCAYMHNVVSEIEKLQIKLSQRKQLSKREQALLGDLPHYKFQLEYMLTEMEKACDK